MSSEVKRTQVNFRIDASLLEQIKIAAEEQEISYTKFIINSCKAALDKDSSESSNLSNYQSSDLSRIEFNDLSNKKAEEKISLSEKKDLLDKSLSDLISEQIEIVREKLIESVNEKIATALEIELSTVRNKIIPTDEAYFKARKKNTNGNINNKFTEYCKNELKITNPKVIKLVYYIGRRKIEKHQDIIEHGRKIINFLSSNYIFKKEFDSAGIKITLVREAFKGCLEDFVPQYLGCKKFKEVLQLICAQLEICLCSDSGGQLVLKSRKNITATDTILPDIEEIKIHSFENYLSILSMKNQNIPTFGKIPESKHMYIVAETIINLKTIDINREQKSKENDFMYPTLSFFKRLEIVHESLLEETNENMKFVLSEKFTSYESIIKYIKELSYKKISQVLTIKEIKKEIIEEIFGSSKENPIE